MIHPPFYLREKVTPAIMTLLGDVTLGTNGAKYRHLNTQERIKQLYQPWFLTLERNKKVLGTITFCRRPIGWYIRYFAFDIAAQSSGKKKSSSNGLLKRQLSNFFEMHLGDFSNETTTPLMYAYIDPRNERSLWMSEQFGFETKASIATQTFSRIKAKRTENTVRMEGDLRKKALAIIQESYKNHALYFPHHTFNDGPIYGYVKDGEILALVKTHHANWIIERLPGKAGHLLTTLLPYLPWIKRIINPKKHDFLVFESLWFKEGNDAIVESLMEGVLHSEQRNTAIWWVDTLDPIYLKLKPQISWGLLHKLNGISKVNLVVKSNNKEIQLNGPFFITGFDFV